MKNVKYFPGCEPQPTTTHERKVSISLPENEIIALTLILNDFIAMSEAKGKRPPQIILDLCNLQNKLADAWNVAE